jgi:HEAT repeat protein
MRNYRFLILLGLLALGSAGLAAEARAAREPVLDGKRLSAWLKDYEKSMPVPEYEGDPQMRTRAAEAVRRIGTNGIPWLLQELSAKETTGGDELPANYYSGEAIKRRWLAATAFGILGSAAEPATPMLIPLLDGKQTSYTAATALGGIGVKSIPVLIQALTNTHACARESAARVLGLFGARAEGAIPALIRCAADQVDSVRGFATFSLGQIGGEPDVVVPVLIANLRDSDHSARWNAACALGKFGGKAKRAVPALLKLLHEDDSDVRTIARDALHQIDPEAAAKAGVE